MDTSKTNNILENFLKSLLSKGLIAERFENNQYLKVSYKGVLPPFDESWNIKIYNTGSVVCTDMWFLRRLYQDALNDSLKIVRIDDSGWGFPLCGVLVGVEIVGDARIHVGEVNVKYFRRGIYKTKEYLKIFSNVGMKILEKLNVAPSTHRIEICNGYANDTLRDDLLKLGFDVRRVKIKGLLQNELERSHRSYIIKKTGIDLYYDPKELRDNQIRSNYYKVLNWGKRYKPYLVKTGWSSISK